MMSRMPPTGSRMTGNQPMNAGKWTPRARFAATAGFSILGSPLRRNSTPTITRSTAGATSVRTDLNLFISPVLSAAGCRPLAQRGQPRVPVGGLLVGVADAEHGRLVECPAGDLQADRQARGAEAAGHGHGGQAR